MIADVKFEIKDNGEIPVVHVDGKKLNVVSLDYNWRTKTDNPLDGRNVCIIKGFLDGHDLIQNFVIVFTGEESKNGKNCSISG